MRDHIDDVRDRENEIGGILSIFCDVIIPYSGALPCNQHKIYFKHEDWIFLLFVLYSPGDYDFGGDSDSGFDVNNSTHTTKVVNFDK